MNKLTVLILYVGLAHFVQPYQEPPKWTTVSSTLSNINIQPPYHYVMIMTSGDDLIRVEGKDHKLMVNVSVDGKVEYGEGYKASDATTVFWEEFAKSYHGICDRQKINEELKK